MSRSTHILTAASTNEKKELQILLSVIIHHIEAKPGLHYSLTDRTQRSLIDNACEASTPCLNTKKERMYRYLYFLPTLTYMFGSCLPLLEGIRILKSISRVSS